MRRVFALLLMSCFGTGALAQGKGVDPVCEALSLAVENGVKELSYYEISGIFDDSAPRHTNRKLGQVLQMGIIQANLQLMQSSKCVMPKAPITENVYRSNALQCELASSRNIRSKTADVPLPECDRASWARNFVAPK